MLFPVARQLFLALRDGVVVEAVVVVPLDLFAVLDLSLALTLAQVRPVQPHQVLPGRLPAAAHLPHGRRRQVVLEEEVVALAVDVLREVSELGKKKALHLETNSEEKNCLENYLQNYLEM